MANEEFDFCCNNKNNKIYSIIHNPKPLEMIPELRSSIDRMLWYVPGIDSIQSYSHYLIDDTTYSEAVFELILSSMSIIKNTDVLVVIGILDACYEGYFEKEICINCQKIIMTRLKNETTMRALLRHIRNAIAHGRFTVVDDLILLMDSDRSKATTSIIKINILLFDKIIKQVEKLDQLTEETILARVFRLLGYEVKEHTQVRNVECDLVIEKNGIKYGIEIKDYKSRHLIGYEDEVIIRIENTMESMKQLDMIPVLIFDKSRVSDKGKARLADHGIILLDKRNVAELLNYNDIISTSSMEVDENNDKSKKSEAYD